MRHFKRVIATVSILLMVFALGAAGSFYIMNNRLTQFKFEAEVEQAALNERIYELENIPKVSVLVLNKAVKAEHELTKDDLMTVLVEEAIAPASALKTKEDVIGRRVKIDTPMYGYISEDLLYSGEDIADDLREMEFSYLNVPMKVEQGDVVDMRIKFPTGQDYTVLSKKRITDIERSFSPDNVLQSETVWANLNEEEIIRLGSAVVDAYLNEATLYLLEYVDPFAQEATKVTYPENFPVLEMIGDNPMLVDAAVTALEIARREQLEASLESLSMTDRISFDKPDIEENRQLTTTSNTSTVEPTDNSKTSNTSFD